MTGSEILEARTDFRAMGTDCAVVVYGADPHVHVLADLARERVELLESLWSRFRVDSELSRMNDRSGQGSMAVSAETEALLRAMHAGWHATHGAFDPTVLAAIRASGYDRDFSEVVASDFVAGVSTQAPGMADVHIGDRSVCLPRGVGVDPGAIGKGLAADIVVDEIFEAGAVGVLVDLGGDIAFAGSPGLEATWTIDVRDERTASGPGVGQSHRYFEVPAGVDHAGIATSTSLTRRWAQGRHHVIDPSTGSSTDETLVQVTVAGKRAWECEVWATAVLVRPSLVDHLPEGMSCAAFESDRTRRQDFPNSPLREKVA
jgi:thiamine biosynthesis lipoprotein